MLINVFRQSRYLTRVEVFVIFYNGDDRNDKETEKLPMRTIARGLWKPCHCCILIMEGGHVQCSLQMTKLNSKNSIG